MIMLIALLTLAQARKTQQITIKSQENLKIAFGSCYGKTGITSEIFDSIEADVFIWLGDASYTSYPTKYPFIEPYRLPTPQHVESRFNETKNAPSYQRLLKRSKIIGVWDDHDYGKNDAGSEFIGKNQQRQLYLNFLDEPRDSDRYT